MLTCRVKEEVRFIVGKFARLSSSYNNGKNRYAYITPSNEIPRAVPVLYPLFRGVVTDKVSIGNGFVVGSYLDASGFRICAHGVNQVLQLGSPSVNVMFDKKIWEIDEKIVQLKSGRVHTLILTESGKLYGWGSNNMGQLGFSKESMKALPFTLFTSTAAADIQDIAVGLDNSFLLTTDGNVLACGWAADGQTGCGTTSILDKFTLVNIPHSVKKISSSADTTLVLCDNGKVYGWGNNEYHQISESSEMQMVSPTEIDLSDHTIVDIAAGGSFSIFLSDKGNLLSCGYGPGTGIPPGEGTRTPGVPRLVSSSDNVISVTASLDHAAGITSDHQVIRWGRGLHHKLISETDEDIIKPEVLVQLRNNVVDVVCGPNKTCIMTSEPIKSVSNLGMIEDDEEDE